MRPKGAKWSQRGHRVTNRHVFDHYLGYRHAFTALGGANLRRSRDPGIGCGRVGGEPYLPRLWAGLGRLHPCRICRPASADVRLRLQGYRRAVIRQPLYVWRRLRHGRSVAAQGYSARTVRDTPPVGRDRRHDRPGSDLATWPAGWRSACRAGEPSIAGALPDLLRAHVHEPEGCTLRGGDD